MQRLLAGSVSLLFAVVLSGCTLPYYWQAIGGQIDLLRKRSPIEDVVADPDQDAQTKALLQTVVELRRFAVAELMLPDNRSYTTYVDMGRPYVVWNVVAAARFSVDPLRWCFPIAGCVSYRGYFDRADAEAFQLALDQQGFDTYSGGSGAYSTLGYFADPVLSTMLGGGVEGAAGILFHELAHQKLYVRDDSELSEGFATVIEEYGVEAWLRERGDTEGLVRYQGRLARRAEFAEFVAFHRARLRAVYESDANDTTKSDAKAAAFAAMRRDFDGLRRQWGGARDYDAWFEQPPNNATLAAIATYRQWLPALHARLREAGLEQFYVDVEEIALLSPPERSKRLETWHTAEVQRPVVSRSLAR
jgi:predicted aminopeptidase